MKMKKYLMTGIAALALCAGFTSCSHDLEEKSQQEIAAMKYADNFVKSYGQPSKTHTWGFGSGSTNTRAAITRGQDNNGNNWGTYVNVPMKLTTAQKNKVRDWFQANRNPEGIAVNWSDFFVQQVYKGGTAPTATCPEVYVSKANNNPVIGSDHMDKLTCGTSNEHINNFNKGDYPDAYGNVNYALMPTYNKTDHQNDKLYYADQIQFMKQSSTECFGYNNSESSQQRNNNYVIIPGDRIQAAYPSLEENGENADVSGMFFVGLDFMADGANDNMKYDADRYYSDWIVRITPGIYNSWGGTKRIICEDLGETDDFDFNDVVFDAYTDTNTYPNETVIIIQAAGGTMPLTVGGTEVHAALKVGTQEMVNTGLKSVPVAIYRIPGTYSNYNNIPVVVTPTEAEVYVLKSDIGAVPQKICVETRYEWTSERQKISEKYTGFKTYVGDEDSSWY